MAPPSSSHETLVTLTADIVAARAGTNQLAVAEVPVLIEKVFAALARLGEAPRPEAPREPAVPIRSSAKAGHVTCLECGRKLKVLKRHLATHHGLSTDDYRERWNLPPAHPLVASDYAKRRAELAREIGLGRKPGQKRGRRKKA